MSVKTVGPDGQRPLEEICAETKGAAETRGIRLDCKGCGQIHGPKARPTRMAKAAKRLEKFVKADEFAA